MAVGSRAVGSLPSPTGPRWPTIGVGWLLAAKLADATTTAVALTYLPLVESNPMVRLLIAQVGVVPGLLLGSVLALGFITAVTELGVVACYRLAPEGEGVAHVRYAGYGIPTVLFAGAAVYNFGLIVLVL